MQHCNLNCSVCYQFGLFQMSLNYPSFRELQFCLCEFFRWRQYLKLNQTVDTVKKKILKGHTNNITCKLPILKWWNADTHVDT